MEGDWRSQIVSYKLLSIPEARIHSECRRFDVWFPAAAVAKALKPRLMIG